MDPQRSRWIDEASGRLPLAGSGPALFVAGDEGFSDALAEHWRAQLGHRPPDASPPPVRRGSGFLPALRSFLRGTASFQPLRSPS